MKSDGIPTVSIEDLEEAIWVEGRRILDPRRPFSGQPHTNDGARGEYRVSLRMRDIRDCYVRGYLASCRDISYGGVEDGFGAVNDMFTAKDNPDPLAVAQNMSCEIEKMVGIYPNLP